jgi:hypothetical protein
MPTTKPGPSRNVQPWSATSDWPTARSEPASAPAAPAASWRNVTIERTLRDAHGDEGAFDDTSRDEAEGEDLVDPLDDGIEHDGGADVGDDEDQLQQRAQGQAVVGGATTEDVARVVQQRAVEKKTGGIEVMYVITNNTPVTLAIFWGFTWELLSLLGHDLRFVARERRSYGHLLLAPPISGRLQIVFEHVAPRHRQRNQHHAHDAGDQRFRPPEAYVRIQPTGKRQGQPEKQDPDGLPHELEEEQRQHLDGVTDPHHRQQRGRAEHAEDHAVPGREGRGWSSAGNFSIAKPTTVNTYMALNR